MSCVIYNDPFLSQIYNPSSETNEDAREFCQRFINDTSRLRYIFGRNEYAKSIAALVDVDGFIDDFFEPDRRNMSEAKAKLGRYPSITYHTVALSDKSGFCSFTSDGSCSRMEIDGLHTIMTGKLDDIITEPVSFIKMDIEGSEIDALKGAQEIIKRNHPKLAICAYHKGDDLRRIPQLILSYYNDYQIFIRHYTEGVDETVIFFIPNAEKGES